MRDPVTPWHRFGPGRVFFRECRPLKPQNPTLDLLPGTWYTPFCSVGEQPLDQGQVPMAYQDATCGRLIPRHNPLSPHSGKGQ